MRIGIVSDTHGRIRTVSAALRLLAERKVELVLHCGDIDDSDTVALFAQVETHFVFGNCDYDRHGLSRAMKEIGAVLHEPFGNLELQGRKIAWVHGDNATLLRDLENSECFDYLFYGHTHQAREHRAGPTRVINPGALQRARVKSCAVLDLATGNLETVVVEDQGG